MKKERVIIFIYFIASTVFAAGDFEGTYRCVGYDPYIKKQYSGTVIVKQQNSVYSLIMNYDRGERSIGTGGQYNSMLMSVVFQDQKNVKNTGLEQYKFSDNSKKVMHGYWVYLSQDKLGKEMCRRVKPVQLKNVEA